MKKCSLCENEARYIDDMDNYLCEDCMVICITETYETLNWDLYPKNGFSE